LKIAQFRFPFSGLSVLLDAAFGLNWQIACETIVSSSFGIASLAILCSVSGAMTTLHNQRYPNHIVTPMMSVVVVLSCFFILGDPGANNSWKAIFSLDRGLVVALIAAVFASKIYLWLSRVRFLQLPLGSTGNDVLIRDIMTLLPAGILTITIFMCVRLFFVSAGINDLHEAFRSMISAPFMEMNDGIIWGMAYSALSQIFWFFGAHGPNLLFSVEESVLVPAVMSNITAHAQGLIPEFVLTRSFFDAFTRIGGSGSTLCLIIAIFWKSRDSSNRKLCIIALIAAVFNVNEPLIYGIPLILNPIYIIPFIATPVVQTLLAYVATISGLVPHTISLAVWTTPPLLSGYITTGSISGIIMQIVNIGVGLLIYTPFVVLSDMVQKRNMRRIMGDLLNITQGLTCINGKKCLNHPGEIGRIAKTLAQDLENVISKDEQLYLEFQPQVDATQKKVYGAEALLRWNHPVFGMIPPPITVSIAEDTGLIGRLGLFVIKEACSHRVSWSNMLNPEITISVNVSPSQLSMPNFERQVMNVLKYSGLDPGILVLEIVESSIFLPENETISMLQRFRSLGVRVAIDDFGMGHASLRYLKEFPVDTVKIDRSLTEMTADGVNDHIVRSIVELSRSLKFSTVVEGVETEEQLKHFLSLGCNTFQGYYFSRPVSGESFLKFIKDFGCSGGLL